MKSEKSYSKITNLLESKNYKKLNLNSVLDIRYIRDEKLKKFLITFKDNKSYKTYALRPDLSLMSLLEFSKRNIQKKTKIYYSGEVFRKNKKINSQIGFEIYNTKSIKDEEEVIQNSIKIFKQAVSETGVLNISNIELFKALVNQLNLPKRWRDRILYLRHNKKYFNEILKRLETNKDIDEEDVVLDKKLYFKMKKMNPDVIIANRKVKDILKRFEQKIYVQPRPENGKRNVKIIKEFLKISCPIKNASNVLKNFFRKNKLNIQVSKEIFPIKKNKIGKINVRFRASELPDVDIYSGLVFSIKSKKLNNNKSIVGGSYNSTSTSLGIKKISAVGAAINL